ncbi:3'-hydroxymethylcephem-O-carbamoyltransferase [Cupriavidus necator]|uniref:3'-hydroxymethylcephem-O-carbamoyltransferase n=1 Tax=Cupriavidus necator TaxID=106590 RepID=A0A1K0IGV4_CUPNE|nr:3'-hydroxymethylcephem-O-carbamoyltransferase [Cupriavidus necator]
MRLLATKPGHDGSLAYVVDGRLAFSFEAEKDSGRRYAPLDSSGIVHALEHVCGIPDALVLSGWATGSDFAGRPVGAGYIGLEEPRSSHIALLGHRLRLVTSSHERSHLLCAYALSPYPQGQPCYALIWEGRIGAFYEISGGMEITRLAEIMVAPGIRYAFAYALADPSFSLGPGQIRLGDSGKLMALAAYEDVAEPESDENLLLDRLFGTLHETPRFLKADFRQFKVVNSGVQSVHSKRLARLVSDRLFEIFYERIKPLIIDQRPLLIAGGCGLNCEWNRRWLDAGLFSDVFVPPCPNDTGSAIGSAADAQWHLTGNAKLHWSVYCGQPFFDDLGYKATTQLGPFRKCGDDVGTVAVALRSGAVLGLVAGRAEMGPRALGNRSIVAAPFQRSMLDRLNAIKKREPFRPIAPVCLEEDMKEHFDLPCPSPYMLHFARVKSSLLGATTHVDGSARVQTVSARQNASLHGLLSSFKVVTGVGVLCNTSLNFNGAGFINRTSDLVTYASETGLDGFVIDGTFFRRDSDRM